MSSTYSIPGLNMGSTVKAAHEKLVAGKFCSGLIPFKGRSLMIFSDAAITQFNAATGQSGDIIKAPDSNIEINGNKAPQTDVPSATKPSGSIQGTSDSDSDDADLVAAIRNAQKQHREEIDPAAPPQRCSASETVETAAAGKKAGEDKDAGGAVGAITHHGRDAQTKDVATKCGLTEKNGTETVQVAPHVHHANKDGLRG